MAPDELIPSILGVPLGSVTPLALCAPAATEVVLLLDMKIKSRPSIFVHPLDNSASLEMTHNDLEAFLSSLGRQAQWIDLEAEPSINKDNPPDLKFIADAAKPILVSKEGESFGDSGIVTSISDPKPKSTSDPAAKSGKKAGEKGPPAAVVRPASGRSDVYSVADSILAKIAAAGFGPDSGTSSPDVMRRLKADVVMELNALRNAAYAAGFQAAQASLVAAVSVPRP